MIQVRSDLLGHPLFFSQVEENSNPSKAEMTCRKVMGTAVIVLGVSIVCAFAACMTAAIVMSSAPLAIVAAAVGLLGIGVLVASGVSFRKKREEFLITEHLVPRQTHVLVKPSDVEVHPCVSIVQINQEKRQRPSVPQISLFKQPSSDRLHVNTRALSNPNVLPGSRDTRVEYPNNVLGQRVRVRTRS